MNSAFRIGLTVALGLSPSGLAWGQEANRCEATRDPAVSKLCLCKKDTDNKLVFDLSGSDAAIEAAFKKPELFVPQIASLVPEDRRTFEESYIEPASKVHGCYFKHGKNPAPIGWSWGAGANIECRSINQHELRETYRTGDRFPIPFPENENSNQHLERCDEYVSATIAGLENGFRIVKANGVDPDSFTYKGVTYDFLARDSDGLKVGPELAKTAFAKKLKMADGKPAPGDTDSKKIRAVVAEMFWRQVQAFMLGAHPDPNKDPLMQITGVASNVKVPVSGIYQGAINSFQGTVPRHYVFNKDWDCQKGGRGVINRANDAPQYAWLKREGRAISERYLDGNRASSFFCGEYDIPNVSGRVMKNFRPLPGSRGRIAQSLWKIGDNIRKQILELGHIPDVDSIIKGSLESLPESLELALDRELIEFHRKPESLRGYDRTPASYKVQPLNFKRLSLDRGLKVGHDLNSEECSTSAKDNEMVTAQLNLTEKSVSGRLSTRCYYEAAVMTKEVHAVSDYAFAVYRVIAEALLAAMIEEATQKSYVQTAVPTQYEQPIHAGLSFLGFAFVGLTFLGRFRFALLAALIGLASVACKPPRPQPMTCGGKYPGKCEGKCEERKKDLLDPTIVDLNELLKKLDKNNPDHQKMIASYQTRISSMEKDLELSLLSCKSRMYIGYGGQDEANATLAQEACHCNSGSGSTGGGGDGGLTISFDENVGLGDQLVSNNGNLPMGGDLSDPDSVTQSAAIAAPELNLPVNGVSGGDAASSDGSSSIMDRFAKFTGLKAKRISPAAASPSITSSSSGASGSVATQRVRPDGKLSAIDAYNQSAQVGGKDSGATYVGGGGSAQDRNGHNSSASLGAGLFGSGSRQNDTSGVSEQAFGKDGSNSGEDSEAARAEAARRGLASVQGEGGEFRKPFHNIFEIVTRHYMTTAGKWEVDKMRSSSLKAPNSK